MKTILGRALMVGALTTALVSCKDLAGTPPLPAGTVEPSIVQNAAGAIQTAVATEVVFQQAFADFIPISGELTDELQSNARDKALTSTGAWTTQYYPIVAVDARFLDQSTDWSPPIGNGNGYLGSSTDTVYKALQRVRAFASQSIGGLAAYAPDSVVLRGQMYALLGYAEVMLADLFCSGVPLSTVDYHGDYTYQSGSTTSQIYTHAIATFDTAITLAASNPSVTNLAKVGQGRAYLALGDYHDAAQAVASVPVTFQLIDSLATCDGTTKTCTSVSGNTLQSAWFGLIAHSNKGQYFSVSDREAGTGLPFVSSHDPRTADTVVGTSLGGTAPDYFPTKYKVGGISLLVLASGLEAQLILAEADLNAGNATGMFTILNALRQNNPATSGMPALTDPGTFSAELDTLLTERAAWLFVDGHRQGDLRRAMRTYVNGQDVHLVANQYPSGEYGYGIGPYGSFIDAPIPAGELANPHFTGCLSRD